MKILFLITRVGMHVSEHVPRRLAGISRPRNGLIRGYAYGFYTDGPEQRPDDIDGCACAGARGGAISLFA